MRQVLIVAVFACLLTGYASCRKKDNISPAKTILVKAVYPERTIEYLYDPDLRYAGSIIRFIASPTDIDVNTVTRYGNQGRIEEYVSRDGTTNFRIVYYYNAEGKVERQDQFIKTANVESLSSQFIYTYGQNTVAIKRKNIINGALSNYQELAFDNNQNMTSFKSFNSITGNLSLQFEYGDFDGKKDISTLFPAGYSSTGSKENYRSTKATTYNSNGTVQSTQSLTYVYEYDADGYPTKRTTIGGNSPNVITYSYKKVAQ